MEDAKDRIHWWMQQYKYAYNPPPEPQDPEAAYIHPTPVLPKDTRTKEQRIADLYAPYGGLPKRLDDLEDRCD